MNNDDILVFKLNNNKGCGMIDIFNSKNEIQLYVNFTRQLRDMGRGKGEKWLVECSKFIRVMHLSKLITSTIFYLSS